MQPKQTYSQAAQQKYISYVMKQLYFAEAETIKEWIKPS
jgi:hypothetical protein